ncbi:hypothetical protein [Pseudomonas chlororaphis]|uniref:hypothetical protein n=1 Tax=Pseudomonas chlororaphis TaxID=587753 RepID=UPI0019269240|nr:hypothetical protein [Pseudomonas chlororaphis]QQX57447.1 hypothetical protein JHW28_23150 [Pseudomonas chlororaphis subsp. aurantiaca]
MGVYSYGWEKLHLAVHSLAGNSTQAERLVNAIIFNLIHIRPDENLPSSMREEFEEFMNQMSSVKAKGDEGTVEATVSTLDEWGRKQAIEKIISFYDTVCRHMNPS